jgi:hypothetical protein
MFVAGDGQPAGFVGVVDLIKTTTADAIRSLLPDQKAEVGNRVQQRGKRVAMAVSGRRRIAQPDDRERCDDCQLRVGDRIALRLRRAQL